MKKQPQTEQPVLSNCAFTIANRNRSTSNRNRSAANRNRAAVNLFSRDIAEFLSVTGIDRDEAQKFCEELSLLAARCGKKSTKGNKSEKYVFIGDGVDIDTLGWYGDCECPF